MRFCCRFLQLLCIAALLSACLTSRGCPCYDTKSGLTNSPDHLLLQQHDIEKRIDEMHISQGSDHYYRLRGQPATSSTTTSLKKNWIGPDNIAAVTQYSATIIGAQDPAAIRGADNKEESRYLLGFGRDYVEPGPNVNNHLNTPSPQPFPSN